MSTPDSDTLQRFHFETAAVRGELVRLGASLRAILGQHFYPNPVANLLGETLAASALLSSTIKFRHPQPAGQKRGPLHPVRGMQPDRASARAMRGWPPDRELPTAARGTAITQSEGQRYQGIVPLDAPENGCPERYFAQSSCQPICWPAMASRRRPAAAVAANAGATTGGTMGSSAPTGQHEFARIARRAFETLLYHLFHQERVRVQGAESVRFGCRCSNERATGTLRSLGERELRAILAEQGLIRVQCEFCQQEYCFDDSALLRMFDTPGGDTVH
jgi:molecular chaperone Hsp33